MKGKPHSVVGAVVWRNCMENKKMIFLFIVGIIFGKILSQCLF